jgi:diadenosine tetraphosphate (Ap4A) HIT family hydrolase
MSYDNDSCPFCMERRDILFENRSFYAIVDKFPVTNGHTLVISKRHAASFRDLYEEEKKDLLAAATEVTGLLLIKYKPDGFNYGINDGAIAGQTIFHLHLHIIPRYKGDVPNPRGGVRWIIPGKAEYPY